MELHVYKQLFFTTPGVSLVGPLSEWLTVERHG